MRLGFVLMTLAMAATAPRLAPAATVCPDRTPASVTSTSPTGLKCQQQIVKSGAKYLKTKLKVLSVCKLKNPPGVCPTVEDTAKMEGAAIKEGDKIATICGAAGVQSHLQSTYGSLGNPGPITSCVLGQHSVIAELISAETNGPTTEVWPGTSKARSDCIKQVSKLGVTMLDKSLKIATKCIATLMKDETAGDLAPVCVGSWSGGVFTPATDDKTELSYQKLVAKVEATLDKCAPAETAGEIDTMFACAGATTVQDLKNCVVCGGYRGMVDAVEQEYSESGTYVAPGAGAIQAAVSGASIGEKLLIGGDADYQEEVAVTTDGLQIVGCGAATNDRPRIIPPVVEVNKRGFQALNVDGLTFQSLDFFNQDEDHIFVAGANGVTFRDITGDGNRNSRYAVFPVQSQNVLVEICKVSRQNDAPIYVGQSLNIVVRYNRVNAGVAGMEIENCGNAQVYGNYSGSPLTDPDSVNGGNTGGLLVFQDPQLIPLSDCHDVHHNVFENNNEPNFGSGTVGGVPTGTGMLVISNRYSLFRRNIARGNDTFGLALTDHTVGGFNGAPRDPNLFGDVVFGNILLDNGANPDPAGQGAYGDFACLTIYTPTGTCWQTMGPFANEFDDAHNMVPALPQCTTLPPPPFGQCPIAGFPTTTTTSTTIASTSTSIDTTTSTTDTTTSTTDTTTSTT